VRVGLTFFALQLLASPFSSSSVRHCSCGSASSWCCPIMPHLPKPPAATEWRRCGAGAAGALLVLLLGKWLAARALVPAPEWPAAARPVSGDVASFVPSRSDR